jgi:hypothetical protein
LIAIEDGLARDVAQRLGPGNVSGGHGLACRNACHMGSSAALG